MKENLFRSDILAIFFICTGSTLFLVSAKNKDVHFTAEELEELYLRPVSILYIGLSSTIIVSSSYFSRAILGDIRKFVNQKSGQTLQDVPFMNVVQGISIYKCSDEEFLKIKRKLKAPMILFALMAGLSGGIYNQFIRGFLL